MKQHTLGDEANAVWEQRVSPLLKQGRYDDAREAVKAGAPTDALALERLIEKRERGNAR